MAEREDRQVGYGLIEEAIKWRRRGLAEPWLADSFLADLPPEALGRLERHAWLLREGHSDRRPERATQRLVSDAHAPVVIVLHGTVKVFHARWDGPTVLVNVAGPGDVLNAEACLTGAATITQFEWSGSAQMLAIPREKFRDILAHDEETQRALAQTLARQVQTLTIQRGHAGRKVEQRLWAFLVALGRRHGTPTRDARIVLSVGLTQADLAAAIGASINSVEAALRTLRETGKLTTGYAQVILHELPTEDELDKSFCGWNGQQAPPRQS
jgi:CRP/FNR family transcriptional regulator, cyclic AMP receptor protein